MKHFLYPFSAIVEQKALKTALLLNAVDPSIGGVLIQGHKGTGKTTAARALAQLLPFIEVSEEPQYVLNPQDSAAADDPQSVDNRKHSGPTILRSIPFVELPLNATEDRLVGSLHIEKALQTGERKFEPGLLAAADQGILYVDEINLLPDHLVDMLLDSAASGVNVIEREGISLVHPARFILIGTMNPEEGELRPQLLDRFGLCVAIRSVEGLYSRKAIVQQRLDFESNPEDFLQRWKPADRAISDQVVYAREHLSEVGIPDDLMTALVSLTSELKLQGHRADITIYKAARAHAALMEKNEIDKSDIFEVAPFAVQHRMKLSPIERPEDLQEKVHNALEKVLGQEPTEMSDSYEPVEMSLEEMAESMQVPGSAAAGSILFSFLGKKQSAAFFELDRRIAAADIDIENLLTNRRREKQRSKATVDNPSGRYLGAERIKPGDKDYGIAVDATLRQAAARTAREGGKTKDKVPVKEEDFRKKRRVKFLENLIVFVVDSSGSMGRGTDAPMKAAKGAIAAILRKAHQSRCEVAVITFGGQKATVILPPASNVALAESALERLPTGGATPFADSLLQAWKLIRSERLKNPGVRPILVTISDGEANVPISSGADPQKELKSLAKKIARDRIPAVFIDAAADNYGESEMQRIAGLIQASYVAVNNLTASSVLQAVLSHHEMH